MDFYTLSRYVCHLLCLSVQIVWGLDQVMLLNPPEELLPHYDMEILYSCDEPAIVQLDCVVYFDSGVTSTHLLRRWSCIPSDMKKRTVGLNLPDWLVYQPDGIIPDSHWVLSCILRASIRYNGHDDSEVSIAAQDVASLQPMPFFSRPVKQHPLCPAWSTQMLQLTPKTLKKQCPLEEETVHLLSSIYASTGENFGLTKTLDPHSNEVLEHVRLQAISFPWCSLSMWIFVTRHCEEQMCGLFHHIDSHDNFVTPTLFLKNSGHLHVQVNGEAEESSAFVSPFRVPLGEWCQLYVMFHSRIVTVSMVCMDQEQKTVQQTQYVLGHNVKLDDTDGYFVIGGGKYIQGVEGYFGPVVFYRNRINLDSVSEVVIPDVIRDVNLTGWLQTCQEFQLDLNMKISGYTLMAKQRMESETCISVFYEWMMKDKLASNSQCEQWEATVPHRRQAAKLSKILADKRGGKKFGLSAVGRALYSLSLHKLSKASSTGVVSGILPLLLQASCLADNRALHMTSVLYSTGLGVKKQLNKAWLLALLAAQRDDRLALLHLGYLHHRGLHGLPADTDLAYAYYANVAKQTTLDRHNPTPEQTFVEAVYLNNDEVLNLQTNEDHHLFQWLKLQARRGATEAEQAVARMLFWGQQGVASNIQKAVRHYERGAVLWEDPVSMYDYAIVLMQGYGVEKDVPKALTFLRKAKDQGFVPAINALAWYYEQFERDYVQAVQLWEEADLLESPDAALNLGVMHLQGLYPGKAADKYMAYLYYLKAAQRGHIRGALLLADIWTTGLPDYVDRRPSDAVLWVKWAAEHNGYLGSILRKALDSYLKSDMFSSLLYYMMAAESGYAAAQFNVAYLCEQNTGSFLEPGFASHCMWRYYSLTVQSQNPDNYAFIKLGDLLYEGHVGQKDLFSAANMYKQAALRNEPQGWYNLGLLVEEGYKLPLSVLIELGLSELYLADNSLLLSALYKRCRDSEDEDSYLPCSFALFNVHLQSFQKDYSSVIKFWAAVAVVASPTIFFVIHGLIRGRVPSLS